MIAALLASVLLAQAGSPPATTTPLSPAAEAAVEGVRSALDEARRKLYAAGPAESVTGEIFRRGNLEQAGRRGLGAIHRLPVEEQGEAERRAWALIKPIDQDNTAWLKRNLPRDGWFRISRDGAGVVNYAFLIVQHSGDTPFMKQVLARMEPLARSGEVKGGHYALLYDRVALFEGRPQRYGSQLGCVGGKLDFQPIENPAGVDARRKAVGLGTTLAEYAKYFPTFGQPC